MRKTVIMATNRVKNYVSTDIGPLISQAYGFLILLEYWTKLDLN